MPEGTSTRPFVHYAQLYMSGECLAQNVHLMLNFVTFEHNNSKLKTQFSGKFESYDYGSDNMAHYGQDSPITYDLSKVLFVLTIDIAFVW